MRLKIYELDPVRFTSAPGLAWQTAFKKKEVKLELLTDVDMLLMVEKGLKVEHIMQFIGMKKLIINI